MGHDGQRPYRETKCRRLQQTTSVKNGAHTAHVLHRVEDASPVVGSIETHTVPMAAHASNGVWTPVGLHGRGGWRAEARKCLKGFGGPGRVRTVDLFHAMEAQATSYERLD